MNDHDKAKLYNNFLQKYLTAKEQITPIVTQTTPLSMYSNESILETVPKNTRHELKTCRVSLDKTVNYTRKTMVQCQVRTCQDRKIIDSTIVEMINDQMRSRKTYNPRG